VKLFIKNLSWLFVGQIFFRLAYFVAVAVLARFVDKDSYGIVTYFLLFVGLWAPVFNFGLGIIGIKEISQNQISAPDFISKVFLLKLIVAVLAFILMMLTAFFANYDTQKTLLLVCFSLYALLLSVAEFFHIPFNANERMGITARLTIIERSIVSLLGVLLLIVSGSVWGFAFGYLLGGVIGVAVAYIVYRKNFSRINLSYDKEKIKHQYVFCLGL